MRAFRDRLTELGAVQCFDYPYQRRGRKSPDRPSVLIEAHQQALQQARAEHPGPFVLIGKSLGSRIGCHVAETLACKPKAIVCLGYPLVGRSGALRDQVLLGLETPILFVQGSRDPLCPLEQLESIRRQMRAQNQLFVVEQGDHSLRLTRTAQKALGSSQEDVDRGILEAIRSFVGTSPGG